MVFEHVDPALDCEYRHHRCQPNGGEPKRTIELIGFRSPGQHHNRQDEHSPQQGLPAIDGQ